MKRVIGLSREKKTMMSDMRKAQEARGGGLGNRNTTHVCSRKDGTQGTFHIPK